MGIFDILEQEAGPIAAKAGLPPDAVKSLGQALQNKMMSGADQNTAVVDTAREHGMSVDKVQEVLGHAGSSGDLLNEMGGMGGIAGLAKKILG